MATAVEMNTQPNIVFFFPDQLRRDFLSCYGCSFIKTSSIDSIAKEGVLYENAYSCSPVCVPARTSLLTGMNAIHSGVTDNAHGLRLDYPKMGIQTWPEILASAGYYTAAVGKMHFYPWDDPFGFQYRVAAEDKAWIHVQDDYAQHLADAGLKKVSGHTVPGYKENAGAVFSPLPWAHSVDHFVGEEARRFIRNHGSDGPFALMVGFPGPHPPYDPAYDFPEWPEPGRLGIPLATVPDPLPAVPGDTPILRQQHIDGQKRSWWYQIDQTVLTLDDKRRMRQFAAALVLQIDFEIGAVIAVLKDRGLWDNTILVLATDHGDYLDDHGLVGKASFYDAATHIPMVVRVPDGSVGGRETSLVELTDLTASFLAWAGCSRPRYMDSVPLPGVAQGGRPRDHLVGMLSDGWMYFDGRHKLSEYLTGESTLFDLAEDPNEMRNLIEEPSHASIAMNLRQRLMQAIMSAVTASHEDKVAKAFSSDPPFGRQGWRRTYPQPLE